MIYYLCYRKHSYTIRKYLEDWGDGLEGVVMAATYESLRTRKSLPVGTYLFADIERLSLRDQHLMSSIWRQLFESARPVRLVNHPTRTMKRYELLRTLYEAGVNRFDVYRLTEARLPRRYPVFIRPELHLMRTKSLPLIRDESELRERLQRLLAEGRRREDLIITEFCDTVDDVGLYRKYSAFLVDGEVIPRHINFHRNWLVKSPDATLDRIELQEEEWVYVTENPHREQILRAFELGRVDYGRIDYGMLDDEIQVWEINTNPNMGSLESKPGRDDPRWRVHELFAQRFNRALSKLAAPSVVAAQPSTDLPAAAVDD